MKRFGVFFTLVFLCSAAAHGFVYETFMATESQVRRVKALGESEPAQLVFPRGTRQGSLTQHESYVYWSTGGAIHRGSVDGTSWETMLDGFGYYPEGLTIDPGAGKIYWHVWRENAPVANQVYRANLDGSHVEAVAELTVISAIALDLDRGKLYWIGFDDLNNPAIMRAGLDGMNIENITPTDLLPRNLLPYYPALTVAPDAIYFHGTGMWDLPVSITYKMNLDGTGLEERSFGSNIIDLHFDRHDGMVYCHALSAGGWGFQDVYRVAPGDVDRETLVDGPDIESDLNTFYGGNIAVQHQGDQTILWFADGAGIKKKRVPSVELLATSIKYIQDIAFVPAGGIYWSAYANLGTGTISRVETRDSEPEILLSGLNSVCGLAVDLDKGFLYWCDPWVFSIYRSSLAGEDVTSVVSGLTRVGMARGLVLDAQREILYWADTTNKAVKYYDLNTRISGVVCPTTWNPEHIALDSARSTLYFTDDTGLYRVGTDGSGLSVIDDSLHWSGSGAGNMQVDSTAGQLYYVLEESLWRCSFDGTGKEELGRLGPRGSLIALHVVGPTLTILAPPRVAVGNPVTLRVGSLPALVGAVTYEWYKDGVLIAGANDAEYTIPSVTHADAGEYELRITDESKGIYLSAPFVLTVVDALPVGGLLISALLFVLLLGMGLRLSSRKCSVSA